MHRTLFLKWIFNLFIIIYLFLFSHPIYPNPTIEVTLNSTSCSLMHNSDFGVCILNHSGKNLSSKEIQLEIYLESLYRQPSGGALHYKNILPDHYIIVETSKAKLHEGDPTNGISSFIRASFRIAQRWTIIDECLITWDFYSPPYNLKTTPILVLEKNEHNRVTCHYDNYS